MTSKNKLSYYKANNTKTVKNPTFWFDVQSTKHETYKAPYKNNINIL